MKKNDIIMKNLLKLQGKKTLRAFADQLGVGQSTLHNYLKGRIPKADFITLVCVKTGCDANWLVGLKVGNGADAEIKLAMARAYIEADIKEKKKLFKELGV